MEVQTSVLEDICASWQTGIYDAVPQMPRKITTEDIVCFRLLGNLVIVVLNGANKLPVADGPAAVQCVIELEPEIAEACSDEGVEVAFATANSQLGYACCSDVSDEDVENLYSELMAQAEEWFN